MYEPMCIVRWYNTLALCTWPVLVHYGSVINPGRPISCRGGALPCGVQWASRRRAEHERSGGGERGGMHGTPQAAISLLRGVRDRLRGLLRPRHDVPRASVLSGKGGGFCVPKKVLETNKHSRTLLLLVVSFVSLYSTSTPHVVVLNANVLHERESNARSVFQRAPA